MFVLFINNNLTAAGSKSSIGDQEQGEGWAKSPSQCQGHKMPCKILSLTFTSNLHTFSADDIPIKKFSTCLFADS